MSYRRRQHRSCDQCRKGKRACDALLADELEGIANAGAQQAYNHSCSNCRKYKRKCTFDWLLSHSLTVSRHGHRKRARNTAIARSQQANDPSAARFSQQASIGPNPTESLQRNVENCEQPTSVWDPLSPWPQDEGLNAEWLTWGNLNDPAVVSPWSDDMIVNSNSHVDVDHTPQMAAHWNSPGACQDWHITGQTALLDTMSNSVASSQSNGTPGPQSFHACGVNSELSLYDVPPTEVYAVSLPRNTTLCVGSNQLSHNYAHSTMTHNLFHIYNDSMENALSCWLTERNCPYSNLGYVDAAGPKTGSYTTNRIYRRVCLLDQAYSSIPGRRLTSVENRTATQVLHAAIMAFASQWLEERSIDNSIRFPSTAVHQRRGMREIFWNQARHVLEQSRAIPSFRVAFAHMLISLTQPPLYFGERMEPGELIDHDPAPMFLETALRQMFTFRSTLIKLRRQGPNRVLEHGEERKCEGYHTGQSAHQSGQIDVMLKDSEAHHTFDLLFWLGIMFDTLTSVIYQRPPVISDEDSQIIRTRSPIISFPDAVDLDGWDISSSSIRKSKESVWGDLFLRKRTMLHSLNQARWPCSYEEAAEVLSDAAPVKVLLFRRITHINTLVCRGGEAEAIEEAIHNALLVYEYWNSTYKQFMLDCLSHHPELPSRIQSWYLVLAGHWHLAAMLLADTLEDIDEARLGLGTQATYRYTTGLISLLRRESAFAVGDLAQYSYDLQGSSHPKLRNFHDSVNQAASLTEPWAAVLIHSFRKAGTVLIREIGTSQYGYQMQQESFMLACQRCEHCIKALQCLGKKSDMALTAAHRLSDSVSRTLSRPSPIVLYNMCAV
ncbi:C6 transcription factor [Aspergillus bombycis]|uniref:C6 transcription factor n=1 Tax=Aspergillus bombycis TaxID=109264 RepID=A0A1F8AA98_9EURO|nr:C6 transcription factor [Aspergillus bombycis]OGM48644.1 C6 transcription factor [Aspergillus bombycis]